MNKSKKFVLSFSGGKDSTLSLYRLINQGHKPVALITTYNQKQNRSWFHGINLDLLQAISDAVNVPLIICNCSGNEYQIELENAILKAKSMGAEVCAFGDIDIQDHFDWCSQRCKNCGIDFLFPLWHENREDIVHEFISLGFHALIKCVDYKWLDDSFLGRELDFDILEEIRKKGADVCGENGEYHTLVYDGPIFKSKIHYRIGDKVNLKTHGAIDIQLCTNTFT